MEGVLPVRSEINLFCIQDLAPELLAAIFENCLPTTTQPISFNHAPLLLCQVCRQWRRVAQTTPRLWLDINISTSTFELNPVRVFQMFLNYSGSLPSSVQLPQYNPRRSARFEQIINILLDNIHRMVEIRGFLTPWFAALLYRRKECFPLQAPFLKSIELGGWDSEKLPNPEAVWELKECIVAPQLERCHLKSTRFQLWVLSFDPTRLRELHGLWLVGLAQLQSLEFLGALTNLEYLDIFIHSAADPSVLAIPDTISIPSLRRLHIGTYPGFDPQLFLNPLRIPNLRDLAISSFPTAGISIAPVFSALFDDQDALRLHSLHVSGYDVACQDYLPWIHIFEELNALEFGHSTTHPEIFKAMSTVIPDSDYGPRWLFPQLTTLIFNHCIVSSWFDLLNFMRIRTSGHTVGGPALIRNITLRNSYSEGRTENFRLTAVHRTELEEIRQTADCHFEIYFEEES